MADVQLNFGQFTGAYVSQVPSYYLRYLIRKAFDPEIRKSAQEEWAHRTNTNRHWLMPKTKRFS
jgi:hypothetical protein